MSYAQLYRHCQGLRGRNGRKRLFPKVAELTKLPKPKMQISGKLNPENALGFIVFPPTDGKATRLSTYTGGRPLIVVAREMSEEWQRFVMIKELMHYFDVGLEKVTTADDFEALVSGFTAPTPQKEQTLAMDSEAKAYWRALGVLLCEDERQELQRQRDAREITDEEIAKKLKMPDSIINHFFDPQFKAIITALLAEG